MKLLKSLTILILTFTLLTLHVQIGAISFSSTYAQTPTPTATPTITPTAAPSLDYTGQEQKVSKLHYAQTASMAALALVPLVLRSCQGVWSAYAYAAGGGVYLVMEIMGYSKFKDASTSNQEMIATLDDSADTQIQSLTAAENQETIAAQALGNKASGIKIFATATTIALVLGALEALADATGAKPAPYMSWLAPFMDKTCQGLGSNSIKPLKDETLMQYYARADEYNDYLFGSSYQSPIIDDGFELNDQILTSVVSKHEQQNFVQTVFDFSASLSNLIIPSALAKDEVKVNDSGSFWSQIGVAAAGGVLAFITPVQSAFGGLMSYSWTRVGLYGALGGLLWTAHGQVKEAQKNAESNARVYASLRNRLAAAITSDARLAGNINSPRTGIRNNIGGINGPRDQVNELPEGAICLTGNLGEQRVDNACNCAKNNTCSQVSFKNVPLKNNALPSFFGNSVGALGSGASSLFAGNTQGANAAFGTMSSNAANLRKLSDNLKGKIDAELKKKKSKYTVADIEKSALDKLENDLPKIFNSLPEQQRKTLGDFTNFGLDGGQTALAPLLADDGKLNSKEILASVQAKLAKQKADSGVDPFKFDFFENVPPIDNVTSSLNQASALSDFETSESDISNRPDESIFKIITVRYFKSAYPRFFSEERTGVEHQSLD